MSYTQLAVAGVILASLADVYLWKTSLIKRKGFWTAYAIILFFQLITNGLFTGLSIVLYKDAAIIGSASPTDTPPPFIGDGRIAFAPIEDLLFGFALVLLSLCGWVWLGRRGIQRNPQPGPPIWKSRG